MKVHKASAEKILKHQAKHNKREKKRRRTASRAPKRERYLVTFKTHMPHVKTILSIGCRAVAELKDLASGGYELTGIDIVPPENEGEYLLIDAHTMDEHFEENQFDLIYAAHSMEHMHDAIKVLRSIRKIAKYGCFLVLPASVRRLTTKKTPSMNHPTIFDIMSANVRSLNEINDTLLQDFSPLRPFELADYHYEQNNKKKKGNECELLFKWDP
ncbi:MAG: class I SAM-dependent methyltransferase [Desulfobacterales bacterium]|jgi:SAM-dependent methyltransferase